MEKLLIICEKPSAARNYAKALGGASGEFEGAQYAIVNLIGHIMEHGQPHEAALPQYRDTIGKFSKVDTIPWSYDMFDFDRKRPSVGLGDTAEKIITGISKYIKAGYTPCISTDIDKSGEGDLLAWEVLQHVGYTGQAYRDYHVDESPKKIQEAIRNRKLVTIDDPAYRKAFSRSNNDFMSQQLTRVATMRLQSMGYQLPTYVHFGRLKSVMQVKIGEQLKAIAEYKPSSVFESRYKLDNLVLTNKDMPRFKTKEEWQADGLPLQAKVREVRQVPGHTAPPKALTFSQLAGIVAKSGIKSKRLKDIYQKMYEAEILTYPRTDDDFITPEQFTEILPHVDTILNLIGIPSAPFTHRQPRPTHVKSGGSHGALRPGLNVPKSMAELDAQFGNGASVIYKAVAQRFLMMFLENTEWIRHEYETVGTDPVFKGSLKFITKQGVTDPDEDNSDVAKTLPNLSKMAELYPHEVKSVKPATPTTDWLMSQLAKDDVGTASTRVSTLADLAGATDKHPIREGKSLSLSLIGEIGYRMALPTVIGSVEGTRRIHDIAEEVGKGGSFEASYAAFNEILKSDINTLRTMEIDLSGIDLQPAAPKVYAEGEWNGTQIRFNRVFGGHEFSDEEVKKLLAGETITIPVTTKDGKPGRMTGKIEEQLFKGHVFYGFKGEFVREGQVEGVWNGQQIRFNGVYMGHTFTPSEIETLLAGGEVEIDVVDKSKKTVRVVGKLEVQEYQGRKFVGYKARFPMREGYVSGTWKGQNVTIKGSFMDHVFTPDELQKLFGGETIEIQVTNKSGEVGPVKGALATQEYQGRKFVGFKADFGPRPASSDRASGVWKGTQVTFKREFMGHTFTDEEVAKLLAGEKITIQGQSKAGKSMSVTGGLAKQSFQGREFVGFKAEFDNKVGKGDGVL